MGNNTENKIISYADDTTIYAKIPSPTQRSDVAASLDQDLKHIYNWCIQWGMSINPKKSMCMSVSRSRTQFPIHPNLNITDSADVGSLQLLGVIIDLKLTFECQLRYVASKIAQKTGIFRKRFNVFSCNTTPKKTFYSFILPLFEYCSPVWMSAAQCPLKLLDKALNSIKFLLPDISISISHTRHITAISMFYKIFK